MPVVKHMCNKHMTALSASHRFSDTRLLLLFARTNAPGTAGPSSSAAPATAATPSVNKSPTQKAASGKKRKAATTQADGALKELKEEEAGLDMTDVVLSITAHRLILEAQSAYFLTRLSTAVGSAPATVIREYANSLEEVPAMEAVLEFMYTEKLSRYSSEGVTPTGVAVAGVSQLQRLLLMLKVCWEGYVGIHSKFIIRQGSLKDATSTFANQHKYGKTLSQRVGGLDKGGVCVLTVRFCKAFSWDRWSACWCADAEMKGGQGRVT